MAPFDYLKKLLADVLFSSFKDTLLFHAEDVVD